MRFRVLNADPVKDYREANKITQGKDYVDDWQPKNAVEWWIKQIIANHSTLRCVRFRLVDSRSRSIIMQIIRATKGHPQPEVESSRPDWTGRPRSSNPDELKFFLHDHTAESFIEMAKQRLCLRTEEKTRSFMNEMVHALQLSDDPFLQAVGYCCRPYCQWYHACPEIKQCVASIPSLSASIIQEYRKCEERQ